MKFDHSIRKILETKPHGITDVLNQSVPGVFTNEVQGSPYQGDVTFRGFRASSILGAAQGLSVYIDGIRINSL